MRVFNDSLGEDFSIGISISDLAVEVAPHRFRVEKSLKHGGRNHEVLVDSPASKLNLHGADIALVTESRNHR